jgi:hypothetical protein
MAIDGERRPLHLPTLAARDAVPIVLRVFPRDPRLLSDAQSVAKRAAPDAATEDELRHHVESALRVWYPRLSIHLRDEIAGFRNSERCWYVMREGRVGRPNPRRD